MWELSLCKQNAFLLSSQFIAHVLHVGTNFFRMQITKNVSKMLTKNLLKIILNLVIVIVTVHSEVHSRMRASIESVLEFKMTPSLLRASLFNFSETRNAIESNWFFAEASLEFHFFFLFELLTFSEQSIHHRWVIKPLVRKE